MAITLEEFQLKLKSEIAAAGSKDAAALQRIDEQARAAQRSLQAYQQSHAQAAAQARSAEREQLAAASRLRNARPEDVKQRQSELTAANRAASSTGKREEDSAAKLRQASEAARQFAAARPELEALAQRSQQARETFAGLQDESEFAAAATSAFRGEVVQAGIEVTKYAALVLAAATAALIGFGLAAASAARQQRLLGQALTGSTALGEEFNAVVEQLRQDIPLSKEQIAGLAQELSLLRLGRRDMQAGLTAIGIVTSALGDSAGQAVKAIVSASAATRRFNLGVRDIYGELTGLAGTGLKKADVLGALAKQLGTSVADVERRLLRGQISLKQGMLALEAAAQGRFGKIVALQMLDFGVQLDKAKENLVELFRDVNLEPLLEGLSQLLRIFNANTVIGRALKAVLTVLFNSGIASLERFGPMLKEAFLGGIIMALKLYVAIRPIARGFMMIAGAIATAAGWIAKGLGIDALEAGKFAAFALAAAFGLVGVAIVLAFVPLIALGVVVAAALYGIYKAVSIIIDAFIAASDFLGSLDWSSMGRALIDGLINGIKAGAGALVASVSDLASMAKGAFTSIVQIGSPSKVFKSYGRNLSESAAMGVDAGAPQLEASTESLGASAVDGARAGASGGADGGGSVGQTVMIPIYIGAEQIARVVLRFLNGELDVAIDGAGAGLSPGVP